MDLILKENNKRYEVQGIHIESNGDTYFTVKLPDGLHCCHSSCFRTPVDYRSQYINDLEDTFELMTSSDYKDRMVAEYLQLVIRRDSLDKLIKNAEEEKLSFELTCSLGMLKTQLEYMNQYRTVLEQRLFREGINHIQGWYDYEEATNTTMRGIPF